jgi:hypothetical protein
MLTWPTKRSAETLDFTLNWGAPLAGDTISSSTFVFLDAQGASITTQTKTATKTIVWVAGGTAGAVVRLRNTCVSVAGRTFQVDVALPISA